jgi:hypothetical protein
MADRVGSTDLAYHYLWRALDEAHKTQLVPQTLEVLAAFGRFGITHFPQEPWGTAVLHYVYKHPLGVQIIKEAVEPFLLDKGNLESFPFAAESEVNEVGHWLKANLPMPAVQESRVETAVPPKHNEVTGFDVDKQEVRLRDGTVPYDTLIVAAGAGYHYFGNDHWQQWAPPLKKVEDALEIRRRVLSAFEMAERAVDPETIRAWLTFVIIGGGPRAWRWQARWPK